MKFSKYSILPAISAVFNLFCDSGGGGKKSSLDNFNPPESIIKVIDESGNSVEVAKI